MPGRALASPWRRRRPSAAALVPTPPAAPGTPSTPSPADTATAYYTRLAWVSDRATKFDVYVDTVNPPVTIVAPKYNTTTYVPTLAAGTTYYWKIVAFNDGGSATGPVWSFTTPRATAVLFSVAGSIVAPRADSLTIHETLGSSPNNAQLTFDTAPTAGAAITIGLGTLDEDHLLFGGEIQTVDQTCIGTPAASSLYPASLIDQTFRLNKRRPFGTWTNVSASTIARYLVATFAPAGFTSTHVDDGLPAVTITFDGSQDFMSCMRALATAISSSTTPGKTKVDYAKNVWLYLTYTGAQPDPLDATHPPLQDPAPIRFTVDHSQLRTRCYGKGHGEPLTSDVGVGETILPIGSAVMFNPAGGQAIASTTADGAQSQILTYAGVQPAGGGSLVGPGASPTTAPALTTATGTELNVGVYQYAYTDVTGTGESLPSAIGTVTTGTVAPPTGSPSVGPPSPGGLIDIGAIDYVTTFVTTAGETTPGPASASVSTVAGLTAPTVAAVNLMASSESGTSGGSIDISNYRHSVSFLNINGETLATSMTGDGSLAAGQTKINIANIPIGGAGTTARRIYRADIPSGGGGYDTPKLILTINDNTTTTASDGTATGARGAVAPTSDTSRRSTILLSSIPLGDSSVTARKLYRRYNATGTYNLVTTIADNTTTFYSDTAANAALGAAAPSSSTATGRRVTVAGIAIGATGTTARKLYRTVVGGSQLKLLTTLADNTTTTFTDLTLDSALGANAPTSDTSGLTFPPGQVLGGSTSLLTTSGAPFNAATGGWVTLSGQQTVRYAGVSGNTLTGIPPSGPGAIQTAVLYGSQVLPAAALTGINAANGVALALAKGSKVHIWTQRDDLSAQAALGALELDDAGNPTDGIREYTLSDERSTEARMRALCDADLAIFSRPIVTARYFTRDAKSKPGRTVSIRLTDGVTTWAQAGDFTIQRVELTFDGPALNPRYEVSATSAAFTLSDLLRKVTLTL
jgi:hypothetical protein